MKNNTKEKIINKVKNNFALHGNDGVSIRKISSDLDMAQSVMYHYFPNKDSMLEEIFDITRKELGEKRKKLPDVKTTKDLLKQRVDFQFDNAMDVIFILKYYTQYRSKFKKNPQGYVPVLAYKHIKEVLQNGVVNNEFKNADIDMQAKIITHSINGFVLEYYPKIPTKRNREKMINEISEFIYRGIKKKGGEKNGRQ